MSPLAAYLLVSVAGLAAAWAITVPLHRYKELRPLTPRDLAAEVGTADSPPPVIRASYREARCPSCHRVCTWRDVTPVLSWIRGCSGCGARLPGTVALVQIVLPLALALTIAQLGDGWTALPYLWLVVVLAAIAVVDLRIWLIPFWMPWAGAAVGILLIAAVSVGQGEPERVLHAIGGGIGAFVFFLVLWIAAPGKLGFGDVRLALLLGMFLAWMHPILPIYGLFFGSVLGLLMGLGTLLVRNDRGFPFGPALALGAMTAIWLHEPILRGLTVSGA